MIHKRDKKVDKGQGHHGEFESGKAQYSTPNLFVHCFLKGRIETQNLGKPQALGSLPAMANPEGHRYFLILTIYLAVKSSMSY